jgi:Tol biopolymer transport system component/DNA-binding winged helix-turn-helix (wHTH) protein
MFTEKTKNYRFGVFELNSLSRQLLKNGREVRVQEQPLRLLLTLLEHPGELVTREELRDKLWATETFVEFDDGLNTAVQKVRQVLGDDARNPRFVETVPRKGYRFIAPMSVDEELAPASNGAAPGPAVRLAPVVAMAPALPESATVSATVLARKFALWPVLVCTAVSVAVGWLLPHRSSLTVPPPLLKLSITPPAGVELRSGFRGGSAISPDGRTVAFVATRNGKKRLWLRGLDSTDSRELPGTDDALLPFWAPDGNSIAFVAGRRLRTVNISGGSPQDLAPASRPTRGAWFEDGTIVFSPGRFEPLYRVRQSGGKPVPVTDTDVSGAYWPVAIPGTNRFLYFDETRGVVSLASLSDTHSRQELFSADSNAVYTAPHDGDPGSLFWMKGTVLVGQAFNPATGKLSGDPVPVAEGVGFADHVHFADLSASRNGVLLYGAGDTVMRRLAWLRRDGSTVGIEGEQAWLRAVRLSPDGHRAIIEQGITRTLWTMNFDLKVLTRLTFDPRLSGWPVWSPDGSRVAYSAERGERLAIFLRDAGGITQEQRLTSSTFDNYLYDWSSDGKYLAYCEMNPQTKIDVWILPMKDRKPFPLFQTPFNEDTPRFSPDVRWIAYVSDETGRNEVYVTSFPRLGGKWQISTNGGSDPRWSRDGRELFYIAADSRLMSVRLKTGPSRFEWSAPQSLFSMPLPGTAYDVAPAGDRFLVSMPTGDAKLNELTVILNWRPQAPSKAAR